MYVPAFSAESDPSVLLQLIRQHPLGILLTQANGALEANHLPFVLVDEPAGRPYLLAHVARMNPLLTQVTEQEAVLIVFRGEQAYISPNWYPSKHESENQVPTWNYAVVHVRGRLTLVDDARFVRGVVARQTRQQEAPQTKPWKLTDSTDEFIEQQLQRIVGLKIEIDSLEGKFKLSQNKTEGDRMGAIEGLRASGQSAIAECMVQAGHRKQAREADA